MQIESIKRWHWCVIGTMIGCGVAAISLWSGAKEPFGTETVHHPEFEHHFIQGMTLFKGWQVADIRNITVHLGQEVYDTNSGKKMTTDYITYEYDAYEPIGSGKFRVHPKAARLVVSEKGGNRYTSFLGKDVYKLGTYEYLDKLKAHLAKLAADDKDKKKYPRLSQLNYHRNFIEDPKTAFIVYGAAGFVVIGLVWPTILNLLIGAGLGRPVEPKLMDMSKYKGKPEPEKKKAEVTEDDMDRLKSLEEQLEASLREGAHERVAAEPVAVAEGPIKKLAGGSAATEYVAPEQKSKDFGAEQTDFYPTEVHAKKK